MGNLGYSKLRPKITIVWQQQNTLSKFSTQKEVSCLPKKYWQKISYIQKGGGTNAILYQLQVRVTGDLNNSLV